MNGYRLLIFLLLLSLFRHQYVTASIKPRDPYDYEQLQRDLERLKHEFGDLLHIEAIGTSLYGKPLWSIRIGKGSEYVLLVGAHHGREWISANLLMMLTEQYAHEYREGKGRGKHSPAVFDQISLVVIPMLNPDGVDIQQGKIPPDVFFELWLMNEGSFDFSRWKANGAGIDLNRQYAAGWTELPSPDAPSYKFYKGEKPLVAKEVKHLVQFVRKNPPLSALSFHSAGQEIYWQFGQKQNIARDYCIGERLSRLTGYPLASPPQEAVGGGFTDWFIEEFARPGFTIELCKGRGETHPDIRELDAEWKRNRDIGYVLIEEILQQTVIVPDG